MEDEDGVKLIHSPFTCAMLPNFLEPVNITALEDEARKFPLNRRLNDLFSLNQSGDLKALCKDAKLAEKFPLLYQIRFVDAVVVLERKAVSTIAPTAVASFREFLAHDMLQWMKAVTGADLDGGEVSSTISLYEPNDYLLCHDDELERRRIAFIIYLVPEDWNVATDGGALELYESGPIPECNVVPPDSGDYHPWRVVCSLPPSRNCLAFFEVCSRSFHQVAEVIGKRDRLSIHGWYMSDPLPRVPRSRDPVTIPRLPPCFIEEELLFKWLHPTYIDGEQLKVIRRRFISTSEIQLPQFFRHSSWERLCKAILSVEETVWLQEGPMDLRNVSVLPYITETEVAAKLPVECHEVRRLLTSEAMLLLLSQMTGATLHPLARHGDEKAEEAERDADSEAKRGRFEETSKTEITAPRFHRWRAGMYTLLADADSGVIATTTPDVGGVSTWRLDLFYHIGGYGCKVDKSTKSIAKSAASGSSGGISNGSDGDNQCYWQDSWNGQIIYVSRADNEELLCIRPEDNALTLVYCDAVDSAKFVRYLNAKAAPRALLGASATTPSFAYDVALSYFHEDDDADDEGNSEGEEGEEEIEDETPSDEEEEEYVEEEGSDSYSEGMEAAA
eukprot:TsM_001063000 transcript=TsM_001063000 gene=TsM_001063000